MVEKVRPSQQSTLTRLSNGSGADVVADLERVFAGLPAQIVVLAPDSPRFTILAASDAYLRATLSERSAIVGKSIFEAFVGDPDDAEASGVEAARISFRRVVNERRTDHMGIRRHDVRRPEAQGGGFEEHYWRPVNTPVLGHDGQVEYIIQEVEDVTDVVLPLESGAELRASMVALGAAEQELRQDVSERARSGRALERSQLLLSSSLELQEDTHIHCIDRDYRYLYFNHAHRDAMRNGYGTDIEVGGRVFDRITEAEDRVAAKENYDRALAGESHSSVRVYGDLKRFYYESSFNPIVDESGAIIGVTCLAKDITARRLAEIDLQAANEGLESFAYSVSHDLRAPLRAIDGFSEVVIEDAADRLDETDRDHLQRVRDAAQHMALLIDGLLALSRASRKELVREDVDVSAMATTIVEELRESEPERHVDVNIAPGMRATADVDLLHVIFTNLLGNAWKFTGTHEKAHIELGLTDSHEEHVFFVRDDGVGFDMAQAKLLFGPFQRLHSRGEFEGEGIGLATVQRLVSRHGGRVWAEGEVEKGATLYFTLLRPAAL